VQRLFLLLLTFIISVVLEHDIRAGRGLAGFLTSPQTEQRERLEELKECFFSFH